MTSVPGLLAFAARAQVDGGFGYLLDDGSTDPARGLETWINSRMTHCFSLAVLSGRDDLRPLAEHGLGALRGPLKDDVHGGWFPSTLRRVEKAAYDHAFVLLAAASAQQAALPGADDVLQQALDVWDTRFWDEPTGTACELWDATWDRCDDYRGANANMHGVEAMLAVADALPERADELRHRCLRVLDRIVHTEARERSWRLPEHFDTSWQADRSFNVDQPADAFRPYGVTVGHQFEWARLAVHARAVLGAGAPDWLLEDARALYAAARDRGWSAEGAGGFVYTLDWDDRPVVTQRFHWVLAEAISAAAVLGRVTGESRYDDDRLAWSQLGESAFADPRTGSWVHELDPDGTRAARTWHGQPDIYHVLQSLLLQALPVTGSLADGVRSFATHP